MESNKDSPGFTLHSDARSGARERRLHYPRLSMSVQSSEQTPGLAGAHRTSSRRQSQVLQEIPMRIGSRFLEVIGEILLPQFPF